MALAEYVISETLHGWQVKRDDGLGVVADCNDVHDAHHVCAALNCMRLIAKLREAVHADEDTRLMTAAGEWKRKAPSKPKPVKRPRVSKRRA